MCLCLLGHCRVHLDTCHIKFFIESKELRSLWFEQCSEQLLQQADFLGLILHMPSHYEGLRRVPGGFKATAGSQTKSHGEGELLQWLQRSGSNTSTPETLAGSRH